MINNFKKYYTISAKVTQAQKIELEKIATDQERSISYIVNKLIENYLKSR